LPDAARGGHDDFATAEAVIQASLAALARGDWVVNRRKALDDLMSIFSGLAV